MKKRLIQATFVALALIAAFTLALLSVRIERVGPELVQYGNLCGPAGAGPCYKPVLKGGFPVAYLFDAPGVSRERALAFGEDRVSMGALIIDVAVYFFILLTVVLIIRRRRSAASTGRSETRGIG